LNYFRHTVGLLGRVISPSQGLYLHRTTQHGKTRTNIHVLSRTRTHDPSNQPAKTHASDCTATVTGIWGYYCHVIRLERLSITAKTCDAEILIRCLLTHCHSHLQGENAKSTFNFIVKGGCICNVPT
jgi:hypothetical protein